MRLDPAVSEIGKACDHIRHLQLKASAAAFLLGTHNWKPWDDGVEVLLQGCCLRCGSTLSYPVRSSVAEQLLKVRP